MEHAQRASGKYTLYKQGESVLILILMEHAQRDKIRTINVNQLKGLNPYFNGTCSKSAKGVLLSDDEVKS